MDLGSQEDTGSSHPQEGPPGLPASHKRALKLWRLPEKADKDWKLFVHIVNNNKLLNFPVGKVPSKSTTYPKMFTEHRGHSLPPAAAAPRRGLGVYP